jgi:hypothetical protein
MIIADLAGEQNILNGVALDQGAFNSMSIIGSIIAGIVISTLGMGNAYYMIAAAYLSAAVSLLAIGRTQQARGGGAGNIGRNIEEGIKYSINNRVILGVLLIMIVAHITLFPFRQLLPVFARDILNTGPAGLGYLSAAPGVGAITGGLIMASLRRVGTSLGGGSHGAADHHLRCFQELPVVSVPARYHRLCHFHLWRPPDLDSLTPGRTADEG